jgi:hypothetical protein
MYSLPEGNTYVSEGREYMCVSMRGIHVCQKEGNTYVSEGREYMCVSRKGIPLLLTHMYSLPSDTYVFPSC